MTMKSIYTLLLLVFLSQNSSSQPVIQRIITNGNSTIQYIPISGTENHVKGNYAPAAENAASWILKFTAGNRVFKDVSFANVLTGFIVTELGAVYKTTNGGDNWTSVLNLGFPYYWYGVNALTPDTVVIAGFNNQDSITRGVVRWSYNGGTTWQPEIKLRKQGNGVGWLDKVHFFNSNTGIVMNSLSGGCFVTASGGKDSASWQYVLINSDMAWFAGNVDFHPSGRIYATGIHFAMSNTFGNSWTIGPSADNVFDGGVDFLDNNINIGFTGGGQISAPVSGWVHRTTDGGVTWSPRLNTFAYPIRALKFFNNNTGYICGGNVFQDAGGIWSTTNAGTTWVNEISTGAEMFSIIAVPYTADSVIMWSVGSTGGSSGYTGKAYRSVIQNIVGIKPVSNNIPDNYKLFQNYPNPFNPITSLRFVIPASLTSGTAKAGIQKSKLIIFNSLGQHVQTLVNEKLSAGEYELEFNGDALPSGVYYYQLQITDNSSQVLFNDTKKMLLIK
jgi:photosystem II stability/assembly factor-like uncharacterized protein